MLILWNMPLIDIPRIGLGTWQNKDSVSTPASIAKALELGYRHIDTAQVYFNEELVGQGIKQSGISRDDIFLATKVSASYLHPSDVKRTTRESIDKLGVEYLDLLYIHWPAETYDPAPTLKAFNEVMEEGLTKHIAVSNFTPPLLDEAFSISKAPLIANQVEMHPLLRQNKMLEYVKKHDIYLVAYSPLAMGQVSDIPEVQDIAKHHDISEAQVSLAWLLSKDNVVAIPKATSEEHQKANLDAQEIILSPDDIKRIDSIEDEYRLMEPYFAPDW
ncbi:MAG: aldo/keto reductase [Candidatus Thorarchaeota archaeon]|jgi:2,5-diketo-D-gluconate reductase B